MPSWLPTIKTIEEEMADEELRLAESRRKAANSIPRWLPSNILEEPSRANAFMPQPEIGEQLIDELPFASTAEPTITLESGQREVPGWARAAMPQAVSPVVETTQNIGTPAQKSEQPAPKKTQEVVPFWQRALQVFSAPFEWVDQNVIKPGFGLTTTALGLIPEAERKAGEDFWEWKRRSWGEWDSPGIDLNVPWSKDPVRIDIRGIVEFAPWLLIPGAGQVGTGARAGIGIAGALGKMGKVGKVLGYTVQYSPWGLTEKVAGAAIKGTVGKTSAVVSKVEERIFGKAPEKPVLPSITKLTDLFAEQVIPARKAFEKELPALRTKQSNAVNEIWAKVRRGEITAAEGTALAEKATAGGVKEGFAIKGGQFTKEETEELLGQIVNATEQGLVTRDSAIALRELLLEGALPEPHHIRQFARVYGDKFAESVRKLSGVAPSLREKIIDALNLPRAVLASGDLSGMARQGLILGLVHPTQVPRAFVKQMRSLFSEKLALQADDVIRADPLFREYIEIAGAYHAPIAKAARLGAREESFASQLAEKLPFVRRSERAFITYLNELRFGAYKQARASVMAQGGTEADLKMLGKFVNMASGRGDLPANLNRYAPLLNTVLFSPRLQAATIGLPFQIGKMLTSKNPYIRKEAAKALVTFVGGGASLLLLLKQSGVAEVSFDPRSVDFGKIKIGDTRLDIWRGYVQYARFLAQMLTGERESAFGNMNKAKRDETAWRFLQSKSSPAFGLLVDVMRGEDYQGNPLFEGTTGAIKNARDRLFPLALQDIMEAVEQSGVNGLWTAAPASIGIGTLTYVNDLVKVKNKIAKDAGYESWNEIDPKTRRQIENTNVELQTAQIKFDRDVMGTAWGDWRLAGNAIEDNFKADVEKAVAQFRITGDGYTFREKISDAYTARKGAYNARENEARFEELVTRLNTPDTAEALFKLTPEQLAIKVYNDALYGDDMYDEFGDYRFDEAEARKVILRQSLGDLYDYVEEYQGMKYDGLPQEFQDLVQARIVLKPYWGVQTQVEKMFGKAYAGSKRGQALIQKQRQRMRRNPDIAQAYNQFYARTSM